MAGVRAVLRDGDHPGPCASRPVEVGFPLGLRRQGLGLCHPRPLQGGPLVGSLFCPKTLPGRGSGLSAGAWVRLEGGAVGCRPLCPASLAWTYSYSRGPVPLALRLC